MNIAAQIKIMRQLMKDYPWLRKVFGSNLQGRHGAGQALEAQKLYGATPGVGEGMMGRAYALPTKATPQQPLPLEEIGKNITTLGGVAEQNPKLGFMIPQIGIGQAGYTPQQVAPLFKPIANQRNIALPSTFRELIQAPRTPLGEFLAKSPILSSPGGPRVLHTGGAKGADTIFQRAAEEAGHKVRAYSFAGHARGNKSRIELSSKHLEVADKHLHRANQTLRRKFPTSNSYVNNLLRRNLYQVKDSDQIIAVAPISKGQVEGGTAWATQMGIDMGKPVFVFDLNKNQWMTWGGQSFIRSSKPTLSANYAGVGSRNITSPGAKAIKDLFGKSGIKGAPAMKGTMYYRYGSLGRKGLKADTTFEAIKSGERTTTTRALGLGYERLKKGDQIEFWSGRGVGKGEKINVELTKDPWVGVIPDDPKFAQHWSNAEGWDPSYLANKGLIGKKRVIVRYKLVSSA